MATKDKLYEMSGKRVQLIDQESGRTLFGTLRSQAQQFSMWHVHRNGTLAAAFNIKDITQINGTDIYVPYFS